MKVAHLNTEPTLRGGEWQMFHLIQGLAAGEHKNFLFKNRSLDTTYLSQVENLNISTLNSGSEFDLYNYRLIRKQLKDWGPDIIHTHTSKALSLAIGAINLNASIVASRRVTFRIKNFIRKVKYRKIPDKIICISKAVRRELLKAGIPIDLLEIVYSGIKVNRTGEKLNLCKALGLPKEAVLLGTATHLSSEKRVDILIDAFSLIRKKVPDSKLNLIIAGTGKKKKKLKKRIENLNLQEYVYFLGYVECIEKFIRSLDCFIYLSEAEGLGTAILKAWASEVPVVASKIGGIKEIIDHRKNGILVNNEPHDVCSGIESILNDKDFSKKLVRNGFHRVKDFETKRMVTETEKIYENLINGGKYGENNN